MSLTIVGKLTVIERNGKNGAFTVGELSTEIGTFKLKNQVLNQFPEGVYDGVFHITRVYNQSNFSKGQIWVSLCADLDWQALQIMAQNHQLSESDVPETLEWSALTEEVNSAPAPAVSQATPPAPAQTANPASSSSLSTPNPNDFEEDGLVDSVEKMQQLLAANAPSIKLDPTLEPRELFRQLRDMVRENGYRFHASTQSWVKP